jgi:tetratricopeptide (TPR) repeat protein
MDNLELIYNLVQNNFLEIITLAWIIWFTGLAVWVVSSTICTCFIRWTSNRLRQRHERARLGRGQGNGPFEINLEEVQEALSRRETELRDDIEKMGLDFELQPVLEHFRAKIQRKLADLPAAHQELRELLKDIHQGLDDFKELCPLEQLLLARTDLKRGETGKAAALLKNARVRINQQMAEIPDSRLAADRGKKLTAQVDFLLGQLTEADFNYFLATQYYQQAANLQPSSLIYLKAAAELSYAFGEFPESEHLLTQVLKIQEKLLGPEHPELAQTLNNLGVLRHTQGRYTEAEAFYRWALEICEAHLGLQDPDGINLVQNYTACLREVGRYREAKAFKAAMMAPEPHTLRTCKISPALRPTS